MMSDFPINWVFIWDLNFEKLFEKNSNHNWNIEILVATNPNIEWEATSMYIREQIEKRWLKKFVTLTRLSRWLSSWYLEYAEQYHFNKFNKRKKRNLKIIY